MIFHDFPNFPFGIWIWIRSLEVHSRKLTFSPLRIGQAAKRNDRIPTIHFREGTSKLPKPEGILGWIPWSFSRAMLVSGSVVFSGPTLSTEITKRHLQAPSFPICLEMGKAVWSHKLWKKSDLNERSSKLDICFLLQWLLFEWIFASCFA